MHELAPWPPRAPLRPHSRPCHRASGRGRGPLPSQWSRGSGSRGPRAL